MSWAGRRAAGDVRATIVERITSLIAAIVALTGLIWHGQKFFPLPYGFVGHDYGLFLPHLLIGENWFHLNGLLAPPYYTPAFCGGMPWLGNPQSIVYSLPQVLVAVVDPIQAFYATLLLAASAGALGTFGALRHGFRVSVPAATLGGVLFLLNGFLIYRMAVGHVTFHVIGVAPLVAWIVLHPEREDLTRGARALALAARIVSAGCLIGYVVYGGALHLIIPLVLAVAGTVLAAQAIGRAPGRAWPVLIGACAWALAIGAMKLAPAFILAGKFPRPYIPENLFDSVSALLTHMAMGVFVPELLPDQVALGAGRTTISKHEYEYGLSVVPVLLLGVALLRGSWTARLRRGPLLAVAGLLLVPVLLNVGPDWWGQLLLRIPVLQNNTTFVRWWLIYLLPIIAAAALAFDAIAATPRARALVLSICVALAIGQTLTRDIRYYTHPDRNYNPKFVVTAHEALRAGTPLPPIERVGRPEYLHARTSYFARNDAFLSGATSWPCYDGLFGYELELLPDLGLREGPVLDSAPDGRLNFVDPESYLNTAADAPKASRFASDRIDRARDLAAYRPMAREVPGWLRVATSVTAAALLISIVVFVSAIVFRVRTRRQA